MPISANRGLQPAKIATPRDRVERKEGTHGVTERQETRVRYRPISMSLPINRRGTRDGNEEKGHWRQLLMPGDRREDESRNGIGSKSVRITVELTALQRVKKRLERDLRGLLSYRSCRSLTKSIRVIYGS